MSKLGLLNFIVCQWFGFRVTRYYDILDADADAITINKDGSATVSFVAKETKGGYGIMWGVLPLTGWWSDYRPRRTPAPIIEGPVTRQNKGER